MDDPTEETRRARLIELNAQPGSREALEAEHGKVWTTDELRQDFEVIGFMAPSSSFAVRRMARRAAWSSSTSRGSISAGSRMMGGEPGRGGDRRERQV